MELTFIVLIILIVFFLLVLIGSYQNNVKVDTNNTVLNKSLVNITNTMQLVNLQYEKFVTTTPPPVTLEQVNTLAQNPLYQTNLDFLASTGYAYPVYVFIWKLDMENGAQSMVAYHPRFATGMTAAQADVQLGEPGEASQVLINIVNQVKTRPMAYQIFYLEFPWSGTDKVVYTKKIYYTTYLPEPQQPYDPVTNPIYIIGSGLL